MALPREHEETEPSFHHHPAATLPDFSLGGARLRVIAGSAFGRVSPVATFAPTLYADLELAPGAGVVLPDEHAERAVYVAAGELRLGGVALAEGQLGVLEPGGSVAIESAQGARAMLVGGAPADGPRYIWWNFVASSRERMEQAGRDWTRRDASRTCPARRSSSRCRNADAVAAGRAGELRSDLLAQRGRREHIDVGAVAQDVHHQLRGLAVGQLDHVVGVKMIGAFCDAIRETDLIDPRKYLAGFQVIPEEIPRFGAIKSNEVKISIRVAPFMGGEIRAGRAMGLNVFLPEATSKLGGFSDACHTLTAATTVAIGKEEELIEEMELILKGAAHG